MAGRLYGVGLGPGDPELLTVKAARLIGAYPVVAYFAKAGRRGHAREIADRYIPADAVELPLYYPMTTELPFDHPEYLSTLSRFYAVSTAALAANLEAGRDVALIADGRLPSLCVRGRKGGSAMTAAAINALASARE